MVVLAGCGVAVLFVPWLIYHFRFIITERATWIGELSVAASIRWFEYLAFGGTASVVVFVGTATAILATRGCRSGLVVNSTIRACVLLSLLTLAAAAGISLYLPMLTSRNMIVVLPAIYVIAAELASCLMSRWGSIAATTYLAFQVGLMGQPLVAYYTIDVNDQWRDSAALVLETHPAVRRAPFTCTVMRLIIASSPGRSDRIYG
jgi:hypothetical protein